MYIGRYPLICMLMTMRREIWGWNGRNLKIKNHPQKSANKCLCTISIRYYITMIDLSVLIRFWLPLWYLQTLFLYQSCMLKTCSPLKCTETYTSKFHFNLRKKYTLYILCLVLVNCLTDVQSQESKFIHNTSSTWYTGMMFDTGKKRAYSMIIDTVDKWEATAILHVQNFHQIMKTPFFVLHYGLVYGV